MVPIARYLTIGEIMKTEREYSERKNAETAAKSYLRMLARLLHSLSESVVQWTRRITVGDHVCWVVPLRSAKRCGIFDCLITR